MANRSIATLVTLSDSDLTVGDPSEDVRGRTVLDRAGDEIGTVEDLMLDPEEAKVRFLQVAAGGFLGMGERQFLSPVDAVTRIDDDHLHVDQTREGIAAAPPYDPHLVADRDYYEGLYGYYGYAPFWAPGYAYPAYPYYRPVL